MDIERTIALVTGGASGLGRELALGFARAGADIFVADIDDSAADAVASEVRQLERQSWVMGADLRDLGDVQRLAAAVAALAGPQVLINNAGGWGAGPQYPSATPATWGGVLDLNLRVPMLLTQLCLEPMAAAGGGVVVNIASSAGVGYAGYASPEYAAAKAGLIRFTTSLDTLPATHGVTAVCVVPDWIGLSRAQAQVTAMSAQERGRAASAHPAGDDRRPSREARAGRPPIRHRRPGLGR